jgi:hypothetical protein
MDFSRKAMRDQIRCVHCSCLFFPDPRAKNQRYCGKKNCQRARKRLWQKEKLARDPDYKLNQRDSNEQWRDRHPDYWKDYRLSKPEYTRRNRELQKVRDGREIDLAKMDASAVKVHLIPVT